MREFPIDSKVREMWKLYPLRIPGRPLSSCCQTQTVLVQSMEGGFVTQNCSKCGKNTSLGKQEFYNLHLWVACPECKQQMKPAIITNNNYGYECQKCQLSIKLASLLPRWSDIT